MLVLRRKLDACYLRTFLQVTSTRLFLTTHKQTWKEPNN